MTKWRVSVPLSAYMDIIKANGDKDGVLGPLMLTVQALNEEAALLDAIKLAGDVGFVFAEHGRVVRA